MKRKTAPGKRIHAGDDGRLRIPEGGYGKDPRDGHWYVRPPGCHAGSIKKHEVVEHDDGTITVSPSIVLIDGDTKWHGYLKRGIWEEC